jgi:hypothetical protein
MPRLPRIRPAIADGRRVRNTCRCATSWASSAIWPYNTAAVAATSSCHGESPSRKKAVALAPEKEATTRNRTT